MVDNDLCLRPDRESLPKPEQDQFWVILAGTGTGFQAGESWPDFYRIFQTLTNLTSHKRNKNYARIFLVSGRYISDPVKFVIVLF